MDIKQDNIQHALNIIRIDLLMAWKTCKAAETVIQLECRAAEHQVLINTFSGAPWQDLRTPQAALMTSDDLTRMTVPTLLVNGEHEVSDFLPIVDELQATLRHASRVVVPGAGGFPLWEFPDQVNALVHNYLLSTA